MGASAWALPPMSILRSPRQSGAFETYSMSSREERMKLLQSILDVYERRRDDVARGNNG